VPSLYTQYRFEGMFLYDTCEMLIPSIPNGSLRAVSGRFPARPLFWAYPVVTPTVADPEALIAEARRQHDIPGEGRAVGLYPGLKSPAHAKA
jgi:hypothetical protein